MQHLVSTKMLKNKLDNDGVIVADCRFYLNAPEKGRSEYSESHIPGAIYFDLEDDLSATVGEQGGRHPFPDPTILAAKLGDVGIDHDTTVVAYDAQDGAMAARFWWLLRYLGHEKVYVLDGGWQAWLDAGYLTTGEIPQLESVRFTPNPKEEMLVDADAVAKRGAETVLIDSRAPDRYAGRSEPMDKKSGHIPGAVNRFWKDNLENGHWKSPEDIQEEWQDVADKKDVMVYCGSGVTACANLLALSEAGNDNAKLYPGSWSDWISDEDRPIEKD